MKTTKTIDDYNNMKDARDYFMEKYYDLKINSMTIEQKASEFFKIYEINTFIKDDKIFLNLGNIKVEISKEEIKARAQQFVNIELKYC